MDLIGAKIYWLRATAGAGEGYVMSRHRFGALVKVTGRAVAAWERGESRPSRQHTESLAKAFDVPIVEMEGFLSGNRALKTFPRQLRSWFIWPEVQDVIGPSADRLRSEATAIARPINLHNL